MRRFVVPWLVAALASPTAAVRAQDDPLQPNDVSFAAFAVSALPPLPDGFVTRSEGPVRWDYPEQVAALVDELAQTLRTEWPRIERELGAEVDDTLVIRMARDSDEMASLAPSYATPPALAVGVAYPASGLVLLTLSAPQGWERPPLNQVLVHELSHVALHRATGGEPLPRWLAEGIATHQARERSFERVRILWEATARRRLIPLEELSRAFPARAPEVSVAYTESADFVEWLWRRNDRSAMAELVSRMAGGQPFETAVSQIWDADIAQLEREWREGLAERYTAFPLLFGSGAVWALISVLVVIAWIRRRRETRATLARWAEEERTQNKFEIVGGARTEIRVFAMTHAVSADERDTDDECDDFVDGRLGWPEEDDPQVPKIVWEGRSHTLH